MPSSTAAPKHARPPRGRGVDAARSRWTRARGQLALGAVALGAATAGLPLHEAGARTTFDLASYRTSGQLELPSSPGSLRQPTDPSSHDPTPHGPTRRDLAPALAAASPRSFTAALRKARDRAAEARSAASATPVTGRITSGYGSRGGGEHYGLDVVNRIGTPIKAAAAGKVISAGPARGFGLWVRLRHSDGTVTVYGHINKALVEVGQRVDAGQVIAEVGNRGQSTGPHLHFEAHSATGAKLDPRRWLDQRGVGY